MPVLIRWYLKAALLYLVAALGVGIVLAGQSIFNLPGFVRSLMPVYLHLFMVGWITQLIFGVVLWMFPKYSPDQPRGNEKIAWLIFGLLNLGLILRAVVEPIFSVSSIPAWGWLLAVSAVLQWFAGLAFTYQAWHRVKVR
jgi:hypothetical protein